MQHRHESVPVSITAVSSRGKSIGTICSRLIYEQIVNYFLSYIVPLLSSTDIYISIWPFNYCCSNFIEFIASKGKEWKAKFSILSPNYSNIHSGSFIPKFGRRDRIYEGRDGGMEKGEGNNFAWKCIGNRIQLPPPSLEGKMERATDVNLFTRRLANLPRKKLAGRAKRSRLIRRLILSDYKLVSRRVNSAPL